MTPNQPIKGSHHTADELRAIMRAEIEDALTDFRYDDYGKRVIAPTGPGPLWCDEMNPWTETGFVMLVIRNKLLIDLNAQLMVKSDCIVDTLVL